MEYLELGGEREARNSLLLTPTEAIKFSESEINFYHCNYCSSEFDLVELREKHICTRTTPGEKQPYNAIHTVRAKKSKPGPGPTTYKCKICSKFFSKPVNLKLHHSRIHSVRPHSCNDCPKKFATLWDLKNHTKTHEGIKPYRCNLCFKAFVQQPNLENHIRTHTKEKPYNCPMCPKSFAQLTQVNNHHRIHTGEKPFLCEKCPMKFTQKSNLNYHKMLQHSATLIADEMNA